MSELQAAFQTLDAIPTERRTEAFQLLNVAILDFKVVLEKFTEDERSAIATVVKETAIKTMSKLGRHETAKAFGMAEGEVDIEAYVMKQVKNSVFTQELIKNLGALFSHGTQDSDKPSS